MKSILYTFLILCLLASCNHNNTPNSSQNTLQNKPQEPKIFDVLSPSQTNINFRNIIKENIVMNGFAYEYLYNGGGVAVGDLNGDDLPEIYFTANLTDNKLYLNKGNLKFEDITIPAGVKGGYGLHQGITLVDINEDGKLDIYICKSGVFDDINLKRNELYINQGNNEQGIPIFKETAKEYGLDLPHYSTQAAFLDYDRDGDLDMFLLNHNVKAHEVQKRMESLRFEKEPLTSDRLFQNNQGKFIDVSESSGMINNAIGFGLGVAIGDVNNDQWPDIIVGHDYTEKERLYLNQKNGTFKEVMNQATGHTSTYSMGNDLADINQDGWLDFISVDMVSEFNYDIKASMSGMNPDQFNFLVDEGFHHQYMYNTLQLNNGHPDHSNVPLFSDIAAMTGLSSTDWSWAPLFMDMDNDGDKDLFVSNGIKRDFRNVDYLLYKDKRQKKYQEELTKVSEKLKKPLTEIFIADLLSKMPVRKKDNYFYENQGNLSFSKKNNTWAPVALTASNGAAYADLDNDGDLEIVVNNTDDLSFIYKNNSVEQNLGNYLKVRLKGQKNNLFGIGSRVKLSIKDHSQTAEQYLTRGFQSAVAPELHFGLANQTKVDELLITWPDGKQQQLTNIKANQTITLEYTQAKMPKSQKKLPNRIFADLSSNLKINYKHQENDFDDFERESLLPHKMSEEGPALAVGDLDGDGLDDLFLGASKDYVAKIFLQTPNGLFKESNNQPFNPSKTSEDVDALFFDVDQDDDLDLYVVSGGNEYQNANKNLQDRLYLNDGAGNFTQLESALPMSLKVSGSVVKAHDFDQDGDLDLFVGGRQIPGKYPFAASSFLLRNDSKKDQIKFTDVTAQKAAILKNLGMVTDALWIDINQDKQKELIIVGEWMSVKVLQNSGGTFKDISQSLGLDKHVGWWFAIEAGDFDKDGDQDLVIGNLGLNCKYQASIEEPFEVYAKDFDQSGSLDIVLSYHQEGELYPLRGRSCSSQQMPFLKKKFPSYHSFASANMNTVYGKENLNKALHYQATSFASTYFENQGNGSFKAKLLPPLAQISSIRNLIPADFDQDGNLGPAHQWQYLRL